MSLNNLSCVLLATVAIVFGATLSAQLKKGMGEPNCATWSASTGSDYGMGNKFTVNIEGQAVFQLGNFNPDSAKSSRTVILWDFATKSKLATVKTNPAAGWIWTALKDPVPLTKGKTYLVTSYGIGYYYNSNAAQWQYKGDLTYNGMQYCYSCSTTLAFPTSLITGNYMYGVADIAYGPDGTKLTWTGASGTNWNDKGNWQPSQAPTANDPCTIPDAGTTANDPTLSGTCLSGGVKIDAGGILNGGSGTLQLGGDFENNGTFNAGSATLDVTKKAKIDSPTSALKTLRVSGGRATILGSVASSDSMNLTVNYGAELAFAGTSVDVSGTTLTNNGTVVFGAPSTTQSVATSANAALKVVTVEVTGASDRVSFSGTQNFTTLTISGSGTASFPAKMNVSGSFNVNGGPTISSTGVAGTADLYIANSKPLSLTFTIGNADIYYTGTSTLTLNGTHTGYFEHDGGGAVILNGSLDGGDLEHYGGGSMTVSGDIDGGNVLLDGYGSLIVTGDFIDGDIDLSGTGQMTVKGTASIGALDLSSNGRFTGEGDATADKIGLGGSGSITFNRNFSSSGALTLAPSGGIGTLYVGGNLSVTGDLEISPSGSIGANTLNVIGTSTISGNGLFKQSNVLFGGVVTIQDVTIEGKALVKIETPGKDDVSTFKSLAVKEDAILEVSKSLSVAGAFSSADKASVEVVGNLTIASNLSHQSTGNLEASGYITIDGSTASAKIDVNIAKELKCLGIIFDASNGVGLTGKIKATSDSFNEPGVLVESGELVLSDGVELSVGNSGQMVIKGKLSTSAGSTGQPPRVKGGSSAANYGSVYFDAGSEASLNGFVFENIGKTGATNAIVFAAGAKISLFDYVRVTDASAKNAAIVFNTSDVVRTIKDLWIAGSSTYGLDATGTTGITVTMTKGTLGGGDLYGKDKEYDPNLLLFWDASPVVLFSTPERIKVIYSNRNYSFFIDVYGGNAPYLYQVANAPEWLFINSITGELYGKPPHSAIGTDYTFDVLVSDSTPGIPPVSKSFLVDVEFPPYFVVEFTTDEQLPPARADEAYTAQIDIIEGTEPFTFSLVGAQSWLSIDPATGEITGTPPLLFEGPVSFKVSVLDSKVGQPPVAKTFKIDVAASGYEKIVFTSPAQLPNGIEGMAYATDIEIVGGTAPFVYTLAGAPSWLTINPASGHLSGIAPAFVTGTISFSVQVSDAREGSPSQSKGFTLEVTPVPYTPVSFVTPALLPDAPQGVPYSHNLVVQDGLPAYTFGLQNAPFWLSIDPATGELSGVPSSSFSGYVNFRVTAADTNPTSLPISKDFALEVIRIGDDAVVVDTPPVLFNGTEGSNYMIVLAASGGESATYTWFLRAGSSLPAGLSLDGNAGVISGTPAIGVAGDYLFDLGAKDTEGNVSYQTFALSIEEEDFGGSGLVGGNGNNIPTISERGTAGGGCAVASGNSLWLLAMLVLLGGLLGARAMRGSEVN